MVSHSHGYEPSQFSFPPPFASQPRFSSQPPLPSQPEEPPAQTPHPAIVPIVYEKTAWEYKVLLQKSSDSISEVELNALGEQGWELVGLVEQQGEVRCVFKRLRS